MRHSVRLRLAEVGAPALLLAMGFFLTGTVGAAGDTPQLIPLDSYSNTQGVEKDPAALSYIAARCSALYAVFSKMLEGEIDPARQRAQKEFDANAEDFLGKALVFESTGSTRTSDAIIKNVSDRIVEMAKAYNQRIERTKIRTNNTWDDSLIVSDWGFCKGLTKHLK